jgi:hypothetical protein
LSGEDLTQSRKDAKWAEKKRVHLFVSLYLSLYLGAFAALREIFTVFSPP